MRLALSIFATPLQTLCTAALVAAATLAAAPVASAQTYDKCGDIVQGVTCPKLFLDDDGDLWLLEDFGNFQVGDRVRVTSNSIDPGCFTICNQGNGCIFSNTIADCQPVGTPYCFGDGSGTLCPCGNTGGAGQGCANSSGAGGVLEASGSASVSADDLGFLGTNMLPGQFALLFGADSAVNGGMGLAFGDGLRCAANNVIRLGVMQPDGSGAASWGPGIASQAGYAAGQTVRFQTWYRDFPGTVCGSGFNLSHGVEVTFGG